MCQISKDDCMKEYCTLRRPHDTSPAENLEVL